ncbi:hypothetical protein RS130_21925 [Paraglaciecola aquimarina]|uniref:Lipoprotein n=1 Tax=Paraglaciecola aquimarina TaxID=1235557 RepID=A0ABU3T1N8_9ALTE|nr:hypothetical protein [Paraglaciecola aquimarina]MDU0356181.1 hypothetical protein [Paraglaciecola aquimarina]
MNKSRLPTCAIVFLSLVLSGCTSMQLNDLFSGYAKQMQAVRVAQQAGDFNKAAYMVADLDTANNNYALSMLEKGRLQFLASNWQESRKSFANAYSVIEAERDKARIRISRGVDNVASILSSDNAIAYQIPAYEQSMLHTYQALNYLYLGSVEGALVEIRRASLVHQNELPESTGTLAGTTKRYSKEDLNRFYPSMSNVIGRQKSSADNAYTYYLSALMYELASQFNDAYIDYKKALDIYPDNTYIQKDVLRLATKLGMSDDLAKYTELFGAYRLTPDNSGEVVILIEQGMVASKNEVSLDLPIFTSQNEPRFFRFALPVYQNRLASNKPYTVTFGQQSYESQELVNLASLAAIDLQQQIPELVTRQTLRLIAKEKLRSTLSRKGGDVGNILALIYNMSSEQADTRSWLTLPDDVQMVRLSLPAGQHMLELNNGDSPQKVEVDVHAKRLTMINVTTIGRQQNYQILNL